MKAKLLVATTLPQSQQQQQQQPHPESSSLQMRRGETMVSESSSSSSSSVVNQPTTSLQQQQQRQQQQRQPNAPIWEIPSTNDRPPPPRGMWRRIFPTWKGCCQPHPPHGNNNNAATVTHNASSTTMPTTAMSSSSHSPTVRSDPVTTTSITPPVPHDVPLLSTASTTNIHTSATVEPSIAVTLPTLTTAVTVQPPPSPPPPPQLALPPVHRSTTSSSNATTTMTTPSSNKLLPPQSPRMERPPKLPPSQHQPQRSLNGTTTNTTLAVPLPPPPNSNTNHSSSASMSQQNRPSAVQSSQRNLSFSSTGSRHRRSSGDWPILSSLQQLSLSSPQDDDLFDAQSLTTTEPQFLNRNGIPPPPPPPPPITMIDQPKCERRISILSDFDNDDDRDDDHLFDLSSDEDDENEAYDDTAKTKSHASPNSLTYQHSYEDSCSGNKSKDACSVSPTTVILPPPPVPVALVDATATTSSAAISSTSSSLGTNTPDWMLEWATSNSAMDTPTAAHTKQKHDVKTQSTEEIKILSPSPPPDENETASCSTSVNSCQCDISSTDEISMSASDQTTASEFVYLPIEPIPKTTDNNSSRKVIFCAGWAVVLWNEDLERDAPHLKSVNEQDAAGAAGSMLSLPTKHNYDESIYYIELLQGGILRCTSLVGNSDRTVIEMSLCPNATTTTTTTSSKWSIVPVCPGTAGACLTIQYASIQHRSTTDERLGMGGGHCYILPVNITARTMNRICNDHRTAKATVKRNKSRHHYWLPPQPVVVMTNESTHIEDAVGGDSKQHHQVTCPISCHEYAPQAQHDAVIFLRLALDAAWQASCR